MSTKKPSKPRPVVLEQPVVAEGEKAKFTGNARHLSDTDEHYSPQNYIEAARELMGGIDIDPASSAFANENLVKAETFFTEEDDGYAKPWNGRAFLNPPGGMVDGQGKPVKAGGSSNQKRWWFKLVREWLEGRVEQAVFLAFSIELLQVAQGEKQKDLFVPQEFPLMVPRSRIRFLKLIEGVLVEQKQPPHSNAIVYLPPSNDIVHVHNFERIFSPFGTVWPYRQGNSSPAKVREGRGIVGVPCTSSSPASSAAE